MEKNEQLWYDEKMEKKKKMKPEANFQTPEQPEGQLNWLKNPLVILFILIGLLAVFVFSYWLITRPSQKERQAAKKEQVTKDYVDSLKKEGAFEQETFTFQKGEEVIEQPYIRITEQGVTPENISVGVGDLIVFRNEDYEKHTLVFLGDQGEKGAKQVIQPAGRATFSFHRARTINYLIDDQRGSIIIK